MRLVTNLISFALTAKEKEIELKKALDKLVSLEYNDFIKNGIGS